VDDSASYKCLAVSETGETSWTASLLVRRQSSSSTVFHAMPDASTFPDPPTRPAVSLDSETSVSLSWQPSANHGASPVVSYRVESFSQRSSQVHVTSLLSLGRDVKKTEIIL